MQSTQGMRPSTEDSSLIIATLLERSGACFVTPAIIFSGQRKILDCFAIFLLQSLRTNMSQNCIGIPAWQVG